MQRRYSHWIGGALRALIIGTLAGLFMTQAFAGNGYFEWQTNAVATGFSPAGRIDYLYGNGTPNKNVFTLQYEHFDENRFGSNWFDIEDSHGTDMSGEPGKHDNYIMFINPRLSLGKITGRHIGFGPIQDISLAARFEKSNYAKFWVHSYGVLANLKIPGFDYFETDAYAREEDYVGAANTSPHLFYRFFYILHPFYIGGHKIIQMTTAVANFRKDAFGTEIFIRPDFFTPLDARGRYQLGLRFDIHRYDLPSYLGGGHYQRVTPILMFRAYL